MAAESRRLILASASPRRRELLARLGLEFEVIPGDVEEVVEAGLSSEESARELALAKADSIYARFPGCVVLGADTLVVVGERAQETILGKPDSSEDARRMLRRLSGTMHRVVTGMAVVWGSCDNADGGSARQASVRNERIEVVTTRVHFRPLDDDTIESYIATGEPMDKAGAYGIQGGAAAFVEKVVGDYYNVVGLSLLGVVSLLDGLVPVPGTVPGPPVTPFPIVP